MESQDQETLAQVMTDIGFSQDENDMSKGDLLHQDNSQILKILLYEHSVRIQKVMFHAKRYHHQVDYLQIYILLMLSLISILFSKSSSATLLESGINDLPNQILINLMPFAFILVVAVPFFIISNFMDALYNMNSHYARLEHIEKEVNAIVGTRIMKWEEVVAPFIYAKKLTMKGIFIKPYYLIGFWAVVAFVCIIVPAVYLCFSLIEGLFPWIYTTAVVGLSIYHLSVWSHTALNWRKQVFCNLNKNE